MKNLVPLLSVLLVYLVIKLYCKNWLPLLRQGFLNLAQSSENGILAAMSINKDMTVISDCSPKGRLATVW